MPQRTHILHGQVRDKTRGRAFYYSQGDCKEDIARVVDLKCNVSKSMTREWWKR
jgi:hypothetical protein